MSKRNEFNDAQKKVKLEADLKYNEQNKKFMDGQKSELQQRKDRQRKDQEVELDR